MSAREEIVVGVVDARLYEDEDDCLAAALADVAEEWGLEEWELDAEWADDQRRQIIVRYTSRYRRAEVAAAVEARRRGQ